MADKDQEKKKKNPPPPSSKVHHRRKKKSGQANIVKIPSVQPTSKCKLRLLKLERIKDFLLLEEEFITNQEVHRPRVDEDESDRAKVDDIRGSPLGVGTLEEIIDDNHAIVSSPMVCYKLHADLIYYV